MIKSTRRQFLRGAAGTTMALPFLESVARAESSKPQKRMAIYYVPMGVVRKGFFPGEEGTVLPKFQGATTPAIGIERPVAIQDFENLTP
ncbi:MAG: hypothetical protein VX776_03395, partial [Planctomycetota bacterium]|nr:hypothetical protein [Planctomycetota bacterium]